MEIVTRFYLNQEVIRVARQQHKASDPCVAKFCAEKNPPILAELQAERDGLRNKALA